AGDVARGELGRVDAEVRRRGALAERHRRRMLDRETDVGTAAPAGAPAGLLDRQRLVVRAPPEPLPRDRRGHFTRCTARLTGVQADVSAGVCAGGGIIRAAFS